jgi:hypothetical protein
MFPCAGVYALARTPGTIRPNDRVAMAMSAEHASA